MIGLRSCGPAERRDREFPHSFLLPASIKDMIEALGVPHTEVELILINGVPLTSAIWYKTGIGSACIPLPLRCLSPLSFNCDPNWQVFGFVGFVLDTTLAAPPTVNTGAT